MDQMAYLQGDNGRQASGALPRAGRGLTGLSQLLFFPPVTTEDAH
jgi:hypothetical protein